MLKSRIRRFARLVGMFALTGFAACSDLNVLSPPSPDTSPSNRPTLDQAALDTLTRSIALAMRNPRVRGQVRIAMRNSRFTTEHKLPLRRFLLGRNGREFLSLVSQDSGHGRPGVLGLLDRLPPLEYYIPNGIDDDLSSPAPPYYNGTSDLQWWGYGIQRL